MHQAFCIKKQCIGHCRPKGIISLGLWFERIVILVPLALVTSICRICMYSDVTGSYSYKVSLKRPFIWLGNCSLLVVLLRNPCDHVDIRFEFYAGGRDSNLAMFSPVEELLPKGSPTDSVLSAAAASAEAKARSDNLSQHFSTKDGYISQVNKLLTTAPTRRSEGFKNYRSGCAFLELSLRCRYHV